MIRKSEKEMKLSRIIVDTEYQVRKTINGVFVGRFAEAMSIGHVFPPITVEAETNKVVCGFTRLEAYKKVFEPDYKIPVEVIKFENEVERILYATEENTKHGQPLDSFDIKIIGDRLRELGVDDSEIAMKVGWTLTKLEKELGRRVIVRERVLTEREKKQIVKQTSGQIKVGKKTEGRKKIKRIVLDKSRLVKAGLNHLVGKTISESVYRNIVDHYMGFSASVFANQLIMRIDDGTLNTGHAPEMEILTLLYKKLGTVVHN